MTRQQDHDKTITRLRPNNNRNTTEQQQDHNKTTARPKKNRKQEDHDKTTARPIQNNNNKTVRRTMVGHQLPAEKVKSEQTSDDETRICQDHKLQLRETYPVANLTTQRKTRSNPEDKRSDQIEKYLKPQANGRRKNP